MCVCVCVLPLDLRDYKISLSIQFINGWNEMYKVRITDILLQKHMVKVVANKDFGHSRKWILTYQICNAVVLDRLFQF